MSVKFTQKELISALQIVGNHIGLGESIIPMIEGCGLNTTVQKIVYKMFVRDVNSYFVTDDVLYDSIMLIKKYCIEIDEKGEINFA